MDKSNTNKFISVAEPALIGNEEEYVLDCLHSTWISSSGKYIQRFEKEFAEFCSVKHAISVSNGTVALHASLLALGVSSGDEIIIPTLTYVASANAVTYCGAKPVCIDSEPKTWNIDVSKIESAITSRTKGIMAVHLYGHPADMEAILVLAKKYNLFVLEDAAEAHGAKYKGQTIGSIGNVATFSFYGNKIITTGEGGMVTTNDDELAQIIRQLKGQGQDPQKRYWFPTVGYNYRMTNIQAAIGLAQLEKIDWHLQRRQDNAKVYRDLLKGDPRFSFQIDMPWAKNVYWINSVLLAENFPLSRDEVMLILREKNIETRPLFYPMHTLPMYSSGLTKQQAFPVAEDLSQRGFNLPSSANLNIDDIEYIVNSLKSIK